MATLVFPDFFGGAERFIHGVARAQAAAGHDVTVLAGDAGGHPAQEHREGFTLLRYPLKPVRGLRFYRHVHQQVTGALRALASQKFDILHAHQIASAVPALEARFAAHRVLSFHAAYKLEFEAERLDGAPSGEEHKLGLGDRLKSLAIGMLDRRCLSCAERVIVHTRFVREQAEAVLPAVRDRVRIIPAGLDFERFSPGDAQPGRQRLGIGQDTYLVVAVRRLVRRMGLDILIQAAAKLADRGLEFKVAIGGRGKERAALESLKNELGLGHRVLFLDRVPDDQLPDLLRAADLVVVPSRSMEGFGMSTIEGLACGAPVVSTDNGASPEILGPVGLELLVPADADALADRLEALLRDPTRRLELAARGVESVRARYGWSTIVTGLDEVYRELVDVHARS